MADKKTVTKKKKKKYIVSFELPNGGNYPRKYLREDVKNFWLEARKVKVAEA